MPRPVHIGCSGWNYRDWRGVLYPEGLPQRRWLERYGAVFSTVEINATFYRPADREGGAAWAEETPDDFVFAVKTSRYMTHVYRLREPKKGGTRLFFETLEPLVRGGQARADPLAAAGELQARRRPALGRARSAPRRSRHAFEFRHPSWFAQDVYDILADHDAALVIGDSPKWPFQERRADHRLGYVRLHHGRRGRGGNYSEAELETWRRRIAAWRSRAEVFAYFNNDWQAFAVRNARWLAKRLSS